jgi:hypothetical protein
MARAAAAAVLAAAVAVDMAVDMAVAVAAAADMTVAADTPAVGAAGTAVVVRLAKAVV